MDNKSLKIILKLIFIVLFNVIFFACKGFSHEISVWISYSFIMLSYLLFAFGEKLVPNTKSQAVYKTTNSMILGCYFILEFIIGIICMMIAPKEFTAILIIQTILFAIFLMVFIVNCMANNHSSSNE